MNPMVNISPEHTVRVSGALCIYTALEQKQALLDSLHGTSSLVLDLSDVEEIDSAGYQLLWLVHREARALGKALTLLDCSSAVDEVLHFFDASDLLSRCTNRAPETDSIAEGLSND